MRNFLQLIILIAFAGFGLGIGYGYISAKQETSKHYWWPVQSVDTMKYSRDSSGEYLTNPKKLQETSQLQVSLVAQAGATHVAISTPYDEQFYPVLSAWVTQARLKGLKVWFRGNWSGWEQWFEYSKINREEHLQKTQEFIVKHPDLFEDGDIFTACPECENGGPGDPRRTGDKQGFQQFLIDEHEMMAKAFAQIDKDVQFNINSMNGDVARLIMDKPTTQALGGIVAVDHYVSSPEKMKQDLIELAQLSGGKIVLGEFGAPIPDINGNLTPQEQADLIDQFMIKISEVPQVIGVNYWTGFGGSTAIWDGDGKPLPAVAILTSYFTPKTIDGFVKDGAGRSISGATLVSEERIVESESNGSFSLPYMKTDQKIRVTAPNYVGGEVKISDLLEINNPKIMLVPEKPTFIYKVIIFFQKLF
ncbi:hypothetical protein KA089_00240 [Candidatus Woesebacteria bacterium]|nr:hypothetical protein [Candidatus Woesebacteria bacterium]